MEMFVNGRSNWLFVCDGNPHEFLGTYIGGKVIARVN